jgi:type I restriction enzyme S subunit
MGNKEEKLQPRMRFRGFTDAWEKRKLGTQYKKVIEKNDLSFSTDKIISVANMYFKADESKSDESYMKTYNVFRKGDIAFEGHKSKNFSYGRFVENDIGDGIISHVFDVFRPTVEFDLNYWKYAIHYEPIMGRLLMRSTTKATMMNSLVSKDFLKQELAIPNLEEQVKIGTFFAHLDNLIAVNQRKVENLRQLKTGLLQKMFVSEGSEIPEIRFAGFTDAWEKRKLGELNDVRDGTHDSPKYVVNGHPFVTSKNLSDQGLDLSDVSYISDEDFAAFNKRSKVDVGDILFGMIGTIGHPVLVESDSFAIKNVALIKGGGKISNCYLLQLLKSPVFDRYVKRENTGGTQKFLGLNLVRDFVLRVPNDDEQRKIGTFFAYLDNLIAVNQRKVELLQKLKKGYLQNLFA